METPTLTCEPRSQLGHKVRHLRTEGWVPGVIYGGDQPTQAIQLNAKAVERFTQQSSAAHLIDLEGPAMPRTRVLIREIQRHPLRRHVIHMDFVRIGRDTKIRVEVPLVLVGSAPVTAEGAIVLLNESTVEIECLPDDLPEHIEVDVSGLAHLHDRITLAELVLPKGVRLLAEHPDEPAVSVTIPRAVAHEMGEEEEEAAPAEPELVRTRKEEEE